MVLVWGPKGGTQRLPTVGCVTRVAAYQKEEVYSRLRNAVERANGNAQHPPVRLAGIYPSILRSVIAVCNHTTNCPHGLVEPLLVPALQTEARARGQGPVCAAYSLCERERVSDRSVSASRSVKGLMTILYSS